MNRYPLWLLLGVASGFLWGCNNYLYAAGVYEATEGLLPIGILFPLVCTAINDVSAAVFLLTLNGVRGVLRSGHTVIASRSGVFLIAAALLGGPLGQLSYCLGILWAGPTYALALSALYPVVGCILARIFLHQRMNTGMCIGISLAVVGAVLAGLTEPESVPPLLSRGILCSLLAALCWGSEIVLAVRGMDDISPGLAITLRESISGVVLLVVTFVLLSGSSVWLSFSDKMLALGTLVFAGVAAGASYFLWYAVNRAIGCAHGMATNASYIIWGALLQWGLGNDPPSRLMVFGCALVFAGVLLVSLYPQKEEMHCDE